MSDQGRSARGRAAETAASPPTRTKSSISVVTKRTFNKRPRRAPWLADARMTYAVTHLCKNGSNFAQCKREPFRFDLEKGFSDAAVHFRFPGRTTSGNSWDDSNREPRELSYSML